MVETAVMRERAGSTTKSRLGYARWLVVSALAACAPTPASCPQAMPADATPQAGTAGLSRSTYQPPPDLDVTLKPDPDYSSVHVTISARGSAADLARWTLSARGSGISDLKFSDGQSPVEFDSGSTSGGGLTVRPKRSPEGTLKADYSVSSDPQAITNSLAPAIDPNRMRLSGEAVLLLPDAFDQREVRARLRVEAHPFGPDSGAATSFGVEPNMMGWSLTGNAFRRISVLAGPLGVARFDAPEGLDRAAWLGYSSFDPRQVAAEVAGFRTGARQFLGQRDSLPLTLLLNIDDRPKGAFDVTRRTLSVLVNSGLSQGWDAPLRLSVAQQVLREWIGAKLAILPTNAKRPLEAAWFSDGLNRSLARELLFQFGLLTPDEYRDEVEHLIELYVTSRYAKLSLDQLDVASRRDQAEVQVVARGALYATLVDARLRDATRGKESLRDVLVDLFKLAEQRRSALPASAWVTALAQRLGPEASQLDQNQLRGKQEIRLPSTALGPCFAARAGVYVAFDRGFEVKPGEPIVGAVDSDSAALKAGLREGDRIRNPEALRSPQSAKLTLAVQRADQELEIEVAPSERKVTQQRFVRLPGKRDDECQKR